MQHAVQESHRLLTSCGRFPRPNETAASRGNLRARRSFHQEAITINKYREREREEAKPLSTTDLDDGDARFDLSSELPLSRLLLGVTGGWSPFPAQPILGRLLI